MGKARWFVLGGCFTFLGAGGALAACGGDEAGVVVAADAGGAQDGTTSAEDAPTTVPDDAGGGGNADSSTPREGGGPDAGPGQTGSNPGKLTCGGAECVAPGQTCCIPASDAGPSCRDAGGGGGGGGGGGACIGASIACDEKADCTGADLCCLGVTATGLASSCRAACNNGRIQVCKVNAECTTGDAGCQEFTCPGGRTIRSCTKPTGCN